MKLYLMLAVVGFTLGGCVSSGALKNLPTYDSSKPSGTVYIGYERRILPEGSRIVILNGKSIFSINVGQYTKLQLAEGKYEIAAACVTVAGWSGKEESTLFNVSEGSETYFSIKTNMKCNNSRKKDDIKLVSDGAKQAAIAAYNYIDLGQITAVANTTAVVERKNIVCCQISGNYIKQQPLKGSISVEQNGDSVVITGQDLFNSTLNQIMALRGKPAPIEPPIKIVGKIVSTGIIGEWWYTNAPNEKKKFEADIQLAKKEGYLLFFGGDLTGMFHKVE